MATKTTIAKPEDRLSIRASKDQKTTLRRAAEARHLNVSQFVLQASLDEAERILADEASLVLSAEDYDWLVRRMDEPARDLPGLRKALTQKPVWEAEFSHLKPSIDSAL